MASPQCMHFRALELYGTISAGWRPDDVLDRDLPDRNEHAWLESWP